MPFVQLASAEDAHALTGDLRPEDEADIHAMCVQEPLTALIHGVRSSDVPLATQDDDGSTIGQFDVVTT